MSDNNPKTPELDMTEMEAELASENIPSVDPEENIDDLDAILAELRKEIPELAEEQPEEEPAVAAAEKPEEMPKDPAVEVPKTENKKKNPIRKVIYYALLTLFVGVFIYCAVYIANYMSDSVQAGSAYDDIQDIVNGYKDNLGSDNGPNATVPSGSGNQDDPGSTQPGNQILPEYQAIYELNNHVVGWIKVPDTLIDYPVMQTPEHPDYYLYRDFNKQWSAWGCIYAREQCDVFTPCDNVVLYGHHMADKSMFAGLDKYKKKAFWEDHQTFTFDTLYERHTYQVIAVFKTSANPGEGFSYHLFNNASSEEEFNKFIETVHSLQFYDTGVTAEYGDMLLTLSTCEYTLNNGRFVVVAKQIS